MKTLEISGANRMDVIRKTRVACRGVVTDGGRLLVSRTEKTDVWMLPGGGLEEGETLPECCVREILEETGYLTEACGEFLTIHEYYEDCRYVTHYFLCKITGKGERRLTEEEKRVGLVPCWEPFSVFDDLLAKEPPSAPYPEEKHGICLREAKAVEEFLRLSRKDL